MGLVVTTHGCTGLSDEGGQNETKAPHLNHEPLLPVCLTAAYQTFGRSVRVLLRRRTFWEADGRFGRSRC